MKIKILNKNLLIEDDYTSAKFYEADEGCNGTECYNETLDSNVFVISNVQEIDRIELKPYDIIAIYKNDNTFWKYACVDTYTESMECVNPKIFKYEIYLCSETKLLEGIVLPNLKITKVWGQTRSIYYYISQYMREYSPKIRVKDGNSYSYESKWNYSWETVGNHLSLENKFSDECPEMQWNTPTLREVLNDLMMVKDCIPILKGNKLDYLDLTEIKNNINNDTHINYITRSQSSEDYVSEIQMKLENVTNNVNGDDNIVIKSQWFPCNISDENATMTSETSLIRTQYPIYKLRSLKLFVPVKMDIGSSIYDYWIDLDLCNIPYNDKIVRYVSEYKEWITKKIDYNDLPPSNGTDNFYKDTLYQNWTLYYTRGQNTINNLNSKLKYVWITTYLRELIQNVAIKKFKENYSIPGNIDFSNTFYARFYNLLFYVEYETLSGCLFRASKNGVENDRVIIDNQTNSYVDSYNQGFLEYQKANRLGNEQLQINARYEADYSGHIIEIGDIYEDSIIYQCQYQFFKNHTEVNALATKNYVLREYFTGVKSKIRSWRISSGDEALIRHDLEKYYCEFSYNSHIEEHGLGELFSKNVAEYFVSSLSNYVNAEPLKAVCVRTIDEEVEPHPHNMVLEGAESQKSYYLLDLTSRIIGNSLVFTFEFLDNYWAGQSYHTDMDLNGEQPETGDTYIEKENITVYRHGGSTRPVSELYISSGLKDGGVPMYQHRYTDDNGEFFQLQAVFITDVRNIPTIKWTATNTEEYYDNVNTGTEWKTSDNHITPQSQAFLYYAYQRPRVYESNFKWSGEHIYDNSRMSFVSNHAKDSQEITNLSVQIEFLAEVNNICFTKEFIRRQKAINTRTNNITLNLWGYELFPNQKFNFRKPDEFPIQYQSTAGGAMSVNITTQNNSSAQIKIMSPYTFNTEDEAKQFFTNRLNYAWYLVIKSEDGGTTNYDRGEEPILLSFTNVPEDNIDAEEDNGLWSATLTLYMNILKNRNKNIYDDEDRYLIVGKI